MWFTVGNDGGFSIVINTGDLTERCWAPDAAAMISHERRRSRETRRRLLILWRGTHASLRNSADWVTWPLLDGTRMQKNIRMGSFIQSFTSPPLCLPPCLSPWFPPPCLYRRRYERRYFLFFIVIFIVLDLCVCPAVEEVEEGRWSHRSITTSSPNRHKWKNRC